MGAARRAFEAGGSFPPSAPGDGAVIAGVTAAALAITVLAFTPRRDGDWWGATAAWVIGFAGLAVVDTLAWHKSRRRLHQEPPSPGSTGYPSR